MVARNDIVSILSDLSGVAPSGYALALHINFTTPRFLLQTYSDEWISHYSEKGFVMSDPTVLWGFENTGTKRWSELSDLDTVGVMPAAAEFGLSYGVVVAQEDGGSRSIGSFARNDREFDAAEIAAFGEAMNQLHIATLNLQKLDQSTTDALNAANVRVAQAAG